MAIETEEKPLEEMNTLEMVDYFMEQGMTEEQANDLAHAEWQARKINAEPAMTEVIDASAASGSESAAAIEPPVEEEPPTQAPDNGYMPDPSMSIEAMNAYGYMDSDTRGHVEAKCKKCGRITVFNVLSMRRLRHHLPK